MENTIVIEDSYEMKLAKTYSNRQLETIPMLHEYNGHKFYGTTMRHCYRSEYERRQSKVDGGYCNLSGEMAYTAYRENGEIQAETKEHLFILNNGNNINIITYTFYNYDNWDKTETEIWCKCDKKPTVKQLEKINALAKRISYCGKFQKIDIDVR